MRRRFKNWKPPKFNKNGMTKWNWICQHYKNLKLGKCVDIGAFSYINAEFGVELQDDVQIGSHCSLYSVSTIDDKKGKIRIKKNARIGSHSVIMPGVTIGESAVVGAFSFVNKDIPGNSLAYGVPVKIVKNLSKRDILKLKNKP